MEWSMSLTDVIANIVMLIVGIGVIIDLRKRIHERDDGML